MPVGGLLLAVVGSRVLVRLAMHFVLSHPGSRAMDCDQADIVGVVGGNAVDLVLFDVDSSLLAGFALAARLRAADRACNAPGYAMLVAATSSESKYQDCQVGGSAINGVLKMPCDVLQFADRIDRWCPAADHRADSRRPRDIALAHSRPLS